MCSDITQHRCKSVSTCWINVNVEFTSKNKGSHMKRSVDVEGGSVETPCKHIYIFATILHDVRVCRYIHTVTQTEYEFAVHKVFAVIFNVTRRTGKPIGVMQV